MICTFALTGCGSSETVVVPDETNSAASAELTPEEQAKYDAEMAKEMGN
ncbi:hypothetical protein NHH03_00450 [Stieleria sp. TO1_6]|nr:hypothetical protein [Stieleria tagensis]MCO8120190.1 hypothetical protein [Stieleria tagensis]